MVKFFGAISLLSLISPPSAFAYLDPGTGSYVFQVAIGAFLGGLYVLKAYWQNIKNFIVSRLKRAKEDEDMLKRQ